MSEKKVVKVEFLDTEGDDYLDSEIIEALKRASDAKKKGKVTAKLTKKKD